MSIYVEVITNLPINLTFQYKVPSDCNFEPEIGKRVHIPFRTSKRVGYIVKMENQPVVEDPRPLIDVIDEAPIFTRDMMELARWISDNYFCSFFFDTIDLLFLPFNILYFNYNYSIKFSVCISNLFRFQNDNFNRG